MSDEGLTADELRSVLDYDADEGVFIRKVRLANRHQVGDRADFLVTSGGLKGYRRVSLMSKRYLAHRLAWLHVHGEWPVHAIDHINGDKGDNRISNLREASDAMNQENQRKSHRDSKSGFLGVHLHKETGKWRARLQADKQMVEIGLFETPELAHEAYLIAKRTHHDGCTI